MRSRLLVAICAAGIAILLATVGIVIVQFRGRLPLHLAGFSSQDDPALDIQPGSGKSFRDVLKNGAPCPYCPEMVIVPAGSFVMGSPADEVGRNGDEGPQRTVMLSKPIAVGKFEITFDEWQACVADGGCADNPAPPDEGWGKGRRPVVNVSWNDAHDYLGWLSRATGRSYRLLSEAEWEYAARAGTTTRYHFGNDEKRLSEFAWYASNCGLSTHRVGTKKPNNFGLHDMHGNVWEWVEDCYGSYLIAPTDGTPNKSEKCNSRVLRGGSWDYLAPYLRSAIRAYSPAGSRYNAFGLRVARSLPAS
ncbi:MAG: formylglycine-generating enzyme family protein [Hyphomicrobiaceae bacterium]